MGNLTPVFEAVTVGVLIAVVLLLICLIYIKRRRYLNNTEENSNKYSPLDNDSPDENFLENRNVETCAVVSTEYETVQPSRVTWNIPNNIERKPRSVSCPSRRNAISDVSPKTEEKKQKSAETLSIKQRSLRRPNRSKTDSCYHVCQIQFTVFYNYYHSKLTVQVICAVNIPSTFGLNHGSFIELELQPRSESYATKIQQHTNNPVFDETAEFYEILSDELLNMTLILKLYTVDRFSHNNLIGVVISPLSELDFNPKKTTTIWKPITPSELQSRISSSLLSLKDIVDKGELTVSLKYQILTNKITVVIMKAVNLPNISKIFSIDPYVVVKLLLNLKAVQTKKTTIKRRTTSPIWNEPLVFEIEPKIPITEYGISFKVKSHNNLSEDLTVGEVEIGYHSEGSGKEHWKNVIQRKNQDRAMCHKIK